MSLAIALLFVALVIALLIFLKAKAGTGGTVGLPYVANGNLFSAAERSFLGALDLAVGREYRIFGKVRVADVAKVKPGLGRSAWQGAHNRISSRHFDFVVCRADTLAIVCAIELNDSSHGSQRSRNRDELIAGICRVINLPLMQIAARKSYAVTELQAQFQAAIGAARESQTPAPERQTKQVAKRITAEK